jgi:hypothetical protein
MITEQHGSNKMDESIRLTGNPFVDTGLAVIAREAGLDSIDGLRLSHLFETHRDGASLAEVNSKLKSFTMFFTTNSLLTNPSIKDSGERRRLYSKVTTAFLNNIGNETIDERCESCGRRKSLDFNSIVQLALGENKEKRNKHERYVGRDWFPLSGSLTNDAQALPSSSRPVALCALCLFAVHYAPFASILYEGKLALFSSTSKEFWYELVSDFHGQVRGHISSEDYETIGKKSGSVVMINALLDVFYKLQLRGRGRVTDDLTVHVWQFSNAQSQHCAIIQIPNDTLRFLQALRLEGLGNEVMRLTAGERSPENSLLRCLIEKKDWLRLYPYHGSTGASPLLFSFYQNRLLGRSAGALKSAFIISSSFWSGNKDGERFRREFGRKKGGTARLKREIANLVSEGKLTPTDYLTLFPIDSNARTRSESWGWNLIRYYLWNRENFEIATSVEDSEEKVDTAYCYYAGMFYNELSQKHGRDGFSKRVMDRMERNEIGISWLQMRFFVCARNYPGFTFDDWLRYFCDGDGKPDLWEPLFRMRLIWAQALTNGEQVMDMEKLGRKQEDGKSTSSDGELPSWLQHSLREFVQSYRSNMGDARYIALLDDLQSSAIGTTRLRQLMSRYLQIDKGEWDSFFNEGGLNRPHVFGTILFLENLYRTTFR